MRIAIVDDMAQERQLLRQRLEHSLEARGIRGELTEFESGEAFLEASRQQRFTAAFLDIYMDGINGIAAATQLRQFDPECLLIFSTTSTDHALEGFRVRAMHYLVKPYAQKDVSQLMEEILARIPQPDRCIPVRTNGSEVQLQLRDIVYAEHFSHMIHIHTTFGKVLITRQSFGEFTAPLKQEPRFFQCSRGVVVNLEHALDFDGTCFALEGGGSAQVSRELCKAARQAFMDFLFQRGRG